MIRPSDIEDKEFKKVAVGYSPEEVDRFLDEICVDYEQLFRENREMKMKLNNMANNNTAVSQMTAPLPKAQQQTAPVPTAPLSPQQTSQSIEKALAKTLTLAERVAEETKENARAAAAQITESAVAKAEEIIGSARTRAFELEQDIHRLESRYELMKTRVKLLLYAEIELLDKNEIISQKEADYPQEGETFQNPQQS
ncbi:MAG: DivIVA domain-containing protein [Firmicutes bacterium]|jgi:cell division initiation protein|nr:DivIVA domain-containing protein [Bacillota bacterium]